MQEESVSREKSDFFLNIAHLCQCLLPRIPAFLIEALGFNLHCCSALAAHFKLSDA